MKVAINCLVCSTEFEVYPSAFKYGNPTFCSHKCMGKNKKGKPSYIRDAQHREKMSKVISSMDLSRQSKMFAEIGFSRKGKTYEEIWGPEKAKEIKAKLARPGVTNPNWMDGRSQFGYSNFGRALKRKIKERDGYICVLCKVTDEDERLGDALNRGLTIHHIDHDRSNSDPKNLVTLCRSCNSMEVSRQNEWQPILEEIVCGYYA